MALSLIGTRLLLSYQPTRAGVRRWSYWTGLKALGLALRVDRGLQWGSKAGNIARDEHRLADGPSDSGLAGRFGVPACQTLCTAVALSARRRLIRDTLAGELFAQRVQDEVSKLDWTEVWRAYCRSHSLGGRYCSRSALDRSRGAPRRLLSGRCCFTMVVAYSVQRGDVKQSHFGEKQQTSFLVYARSDGLNVRLAMEELDVRGRLSSNPALWTFAGREPRSSR